MTQDPLLTRSTARNDHGATKSGTRDAWRMRVTNVALLPLAIAFVWIVFRLVGRGQAGVRAELAHPYAAILMLLFIVTAIIHMKMGMQSIIDDYVHAARLKELSMLGNVLFCVGLGVAAIYAVLKLSLV